MNLTTSFGCIRSFTYDDVDALARYADNRKIWLNLRDVFPHPYNRDDAEGFIKMALAADEQHTFAISRNGEYIGTIGYHPQEDVNRYSAEVGYWIGEPFWGQGITTEAVAILTRYVFEQTEMIRLFALPFATNPASCRVLEKAGYRQEALMKKAVVKDGEVLDQYIYAITR